MERGRFLYRTSLNYTDPKFASARVAGDVAPGTNFRADCLAHSVPMRNGRELSGHSEQEMIDTMGFALASLSSAEQSLINSVNAMDIEHDLAKRATYYHALERLVMRLYGGSYVRAFNFVLRQSDCLGVHTRPVGDNAPRGPVNDVHADFTPDAPAIEQINSLGASLGLHGCRWAIINCWRNISQTPVQQWPMAVCDVMSVRAEDCVARATPENGNLIYGMLPSDQHDWYTFPDMQQHEVLLLKQYDSEENLSRFTQHTSFDAPSQLVHPATRQSTEVRVLCFFMDICDDRMRSSALLQQVAAGKGILATDTRTESRL